MKKNNNFSLKNILILTFLLLVFISISAYSYAKTVSSDLSNAVFRLHIIANSDTDFDQSLKLKVRDSLLTYMNGLTNGITSKEDVIKIAQSHISDFKQLAQKIVFQNGYNYPVNVEIGNFEFPTKSYGNISFPAGYYDALEVKIGNASGHNWWCVMFPPLCFVDVSSGVVPDDSKETLQENLSSEDYSIISDSENSSTVQFKFKIVELFKNFGLKLANN